MPDRMFAWGMNGAAWQVCRKKKGTASAKMIAGPCRQGDEREQRTGWGDVSEETPKCELDWDGECESLS